MGKERIDKIVAFVHPPFLLMSEEFNPEDYTDRYYEGLTPEEIKRISEYPYRRFFEAYKKSLEMHSATNTLFIYVRKNKAHIMEDEFEKLLRAKVKNCEVFTEPFPTHLQGRIKKVVGKYNFNPKKVEVIGFGSFEQWCVPTTLRVIDEELKLKHQQVKINLKNRGIKLLNFVHTTGRLQETLIRKIRKQKEEKKFRKPVKKSRRK
ncbi:MAG: hypothetical protein V1672_00100 [Candidatus Diapherotrites archaeon]